MSESPNWATRTIAFYENDRAEIPKHHVTVAQVLDSIRNPPQRRIDLISSIRKAPDKAERTRLKHELPAATFGCDMHTRAAAVPLADKVASVSGLCCLDFDHVADAEAVRNRLRADPFTCAAFLSPSGSGVKVLVRVADPDRFLDCWRAAVSYFASVHGLRADPARKDLVGLCYLSADPDLYICEGEAEAFQPSEVVVPAPQQSGTEVIEGGRNTTLASLAGTMRRRGMGEAAILAALKAENAERCSPPLAEDEVVGIASSVSRYSAEAWPLMRPLSNGAAAPVLDLRVAIPAGLPELAEYITQTSTALQLPVEMVAPLVVSVASLGVARAMEVECQPGWREPAPVWVACLAEPGERKSSLLGNIAAPVRRWQAGERERLSRDLARYAEARRQVEARLAGFRAAMAKPTKRKDGEASDLSGLQRAAGELAEALAAMPELRAPDLVTAEATPEAARDLLARNGEKLAIIAAEADQLEVLLGRYGDGKANLGLFLAMHAGDYCPAHRVGRDLPLEHPAGVVCLCVQPQAVEAVLSNPDAVGRGLVARFLFVKPRTWLGRRELEPPAVEESVSDWWEHAMRRLLDLPWPGKVVVGADGPMRCTVAVRVLPLTAEARKLHLALRASHEPRLDAERGDLRHLTGFVSKLPGAVARIALAFQALADPNAAAVSADCMRSACAWAPFLLAHTQAVVGEAGDPMGALARKVWRWITAGQRWTFTAGECYRDNRSARISSPEAIAPALSLLESHGLIRRMPDAPGKAGPKGRHWEVNPAACANHESHTSHGFGNGAA